MKNHLGWKATLAVAVFSSLSCFVIADEPTLLELIATVPRIDSDLPGCKSIQIAGRLYSDTGNHQAYLGFRASYRAPDHFALLVTDDRDHTPIFLGSDGQAIVYEPIRQTVIYYERARTRFEIAEAGGTLDILLGFSSAEGNKRSSLRCDVKSILSGLNKDREIIRRPGDTYEVKLTSLRDNLLKAELDPARPSFCTKLTINPTRRDYPLFALDKIDLNGELRDEEFAFPPIDELSKKIDVQKWSETSLIKETELFLLLARAGRVRLAINNPSLREKIDKVDWDAVRDADKRFSAILREVAGTAPWVP